MMHAGRFGGFVRDHWARYAGAPATTFAAILHGTAHMQFMYSTLIRWPLADVFFMKPSSNLGLFLGGRDRRRRKAPTGLNASK